MDLNIIKNKLESFQNRGQNREKTDYSTIFWKPKAGKYQIRIVPSKFSKSTPYREIYYHYNFAKFPILALTNWGEADPIVEAAKKLRKSDNPEHWEMAKKISPKMRVLAPVIVRGEEDKGVRLWEFGKEQYTQLMNIAMNEDYGDYTDVHEGRDFVMEAVEDMAFNKKIVKCTVTPRVKVTPLSEDATLVKKWLDEQPDILTINKKFTYEELNEIFQKWANPDEEETDHVVEGGAIIEKKDDDDEPLFPPVKKEEPKTAYSLKTPSKSKKFDDLFGEEK